MRSKVVIGLVSAGSVLAIWLTVLVYRELHKALEASGTLLSSEISWVFQLLLNLIGYGTILLPLYIIYKYLDKTNYFDRITTPTWTSRLLFSCFGSPERLPDTVKPGGAPATGGASGAREGAELLLCFSGLMGAYLVWGLLQEKIMTQTYNLSDGSTVKFTDSQFLVFINRLSAVLLTLPRVICLPLAAPVFKFSYCSLTNIVSAWCQYEALHYVSFPTQVLSKSCKVIPVMLMSRLVSGQKYVTHEYVTAAAISAGMLLFVTGSSDDNTVSSVSTASGLLLLALYMVCDSFTSSWQGQLFRQHHVSPLQMMCYVNMFSCTLTGVSLLQHPTTYDSIALLKAVSILLSCLVYKHSISWSGTLGITLVFAAVLLRLYARARGGSKL